MKKILFDSNVLLDVLLDRKPHAEASAAVWAAVEQGYAEGLLAAHAVTTIHYLVRRQMGAAKTKRTMAAILKVFRVAAVSAAVIDEALVLSFADFEDAVTAAAARQASCDYIVTRDPRRFHGSAVRPLAPEAILPLLGAHDTRAVKGLPARLRGDTLEVRNGHMIKKLTKHGNSLALVIDRPILDLLKIDPETPLDIRTDGKQLIIAPSKPSARRKKFDAAQEWAHKRYGKAFRKLAE